MRGPGAPGQRDGRPGADRETTRRNDPTPHGVGREDTTRPAHARIDFSAVAAAALPYLPVLLARWLPDGRRVGSEWIARNPRRDDRHSGSMRVSLRSGKWADFARPDVRGGDVISLAAYLHDLSQTEAARRVAAAVGVAR